MIIEKVSKNSIIFLKSIEVAVIISGYISLTSYKENILRPQILQILNPGSIIGFNEINESLTSCPDNWMRTLTDVELAFFDLHLFKVKVNSVFGVNK